MKKIVLLLLICVFLAWISERRTKYSVEFGEQYRMRDDLALILLCVVLVLFAGYRTSYNDTWNYIDNFNQARGLRAFLSDPENLEFTENPLFNFCQNLLKEFTTDAQVMILLSSAFIQPCFIIYMKRYSQRFAISVFLYIAFGTFLVTVAAIKQTLAMAVLTFSLPHLEKRHWGRFYITVFIAMLFHTYAVFFAVLPLFARTPWKIFTFLFLGGVILVIGNFEEVITSFLGQADAMGKSIAAYEVFDDHTVNLFRVAVYTVPPLFSFAFSKWINQSSKRMDYVLTHMSIISFAFMLMATQAGANMFARMAHYFEIGTLCCLPNMIDKPFKTSSMRFVYCALIVGFLGYFMYANRGFDAAYQGLGLLGMI